MVWDDCVNLPCEVLKLKSIACWSLKPFCMKVLQDLQIFLLSFSSFGCWSRVFCCLVKVLMFSWKSLDQKLRAWVWNVEKGSAANCCRSHLRSNLHGVLHENLHKIATLLPIVLSDVIMTQIIGIWSILPFWNFNFPLVCFNLFWADCLGILGWILSV